MASRVGVLFAGIALIAACGDDGAGDASSATTGSARGTHPDAGADDASTPGAGRPMVRVDDGGVQGAADASALDGGRDASLQDGGLDASLQDGGRDASLQDGGLDAALDGSIGDAMPSPMPIEDAALDARAGPGGFGGSAGVGGTGGFGGF